MTMRSSAYFAVILAAGALAATAANADNFKFNYGAHELETIGGRTALLHRLTNQAGGYCGVNQVRGLTETRAVENCQSALVAETVGKIGDTRLEAMLQSKERLARR